VVSFCVSSAKPLSSGSNSFSFVDKHNSNFQEEGYVIPIYYKDGEGQQNGVCVLIAENNMNT
jgi:hypothetical protein